MLCFSCGKSGHAATRCPNLNDSFPFMQPGWQTEKTPGGIIMIPPRVAMDRRRRKTAADPRGGGGGGQHAAVGPCEMPSPYSEKTQEPLEQAVLIQADPAGQSAAVGTLSPSDCYSVGPAGPCVAGGPVGPDVRFKDPEPLTHAVLIHADPAGQHAAAVGTRSPSDCYPAGPAGLYVAGGPVGPGDCLQVLEPFEQLVLDHADPAGQHAVILDTADYVSRAVGVFA